MNSSVLGLPIVHWAYRTIGEKAKALLDLSKLLMVVMLNIAAEFHQE